MKNNSDGRFEKKVSKYRATLDDPKLRNMYIKILSGCGDKKIAAAAVNLHPQTVYIYINNNPDFAERVQRAEYKWRAILMDAMMEQGVYGLEEPIFHNGEQVGSKRKVHPKILELMVKKAMPEYNPTRTVEHNHSGQIEQIHSDVVSHLSLEEKRELLKFLKSKNAQIDVKAEPVVEHQKPDVPNHVIQHSLQAEDYFIPPKEVDLTEEDMQRLGYEEVE